MILDDFAYFKYDSTYNEFARNPGLGISEGTIVFVEDTGNIYARGHQFGGKYEYQGEDGVIVDGNTITLDIDYINENLMPEKTVYTAGNYINISNTNKISVDLESLKDALDLGSGSQGDTFQLKPAEANVLGGIKIGYEDNGQNYRIQLDGNNRAFVHVPWTDTKPSQDDDPTIDDQELVNRINNLQQLINQLRSDLDNLHLENEDAIKLLIKNIFLEADWLKNNFPVGEIFHTSGWQDNMNAYLQLVGLIDENGDVAWSTILQKVNEIDLAVKTIQQSIGENGQLNLEVLESNLKTYVNGKIAGLNLDSKYAVADENQNVIEWMTSGFKVQAGKQPGDEGYKTNFAEMYSDEFDGIRSATALMKTSIEHDVDNKISAAKAEIGTNIEGRLAGVITQSTLDSSVATLFAENTNTGTKSAVLATVADDESTLDLIASKVNITGSLIANKISGTDLNLTGNIQASNMNITGGTQYKPVER